ncbi:MAG: glycosyltransferase domain-containing protein, partial [Balneolales bacterium]
NNGSDEVSLVTLDAWWEFEDRPEINLIKLVVNGNELDVLQGSAKLLKECSPVILLASDGGAHSDSKVAGLLDHFGYHLLEYVPGPQLLTDYDMEGDRDPYLLNLVAVKEDRLKDFKQQGWIHNEAFEPKEPEDGFWKSALGELPWAKSMISNWEEQSKLPQNREYVRGLDYLCAAEVITPKGTSNPTLRSEKAVLLLGAAQILIRLYNDGTQSPSIAMTLVRVLNALGKRGQAVEVLQKLIEHTKPGELNMMSELPFMLPMPELDHLPVKTKLDNWMMTHVIESWLHMCNHSSFMNGEKERKLLNAVGGNVENSAITEKKYLLSKVRTNPEHEHAIRQLPEGILPIRNRWFWHLISENNTSPASRSKAIDIIDIKEIRNYSYSGKDSVAIVMPCIDKEKGLITAQSLYRRAGMPCKIIIVYDSERCGFIKTLNDTCRQLDVRYVVYLAQDAFAGRNWLQQAYNTLEKTGKGLLAFNDGKWQGIIASFGMVRLSWVKSLYGDSVLFQGYKSHCADDELTAIARAADQHVYNPHISLIEVDHEKGMAGGGNISDRQLFFDRYAGGFDGLVPVDKLRQIAGDYHIKDVNNKAEHSKFEREGRIGDGDKHELLSLTHRTLSPKMYLEIGVQTGKSLALAQCESIGVDPEPILTVPLPKGAKVIPVTSDDFFQDKVPMPRSPDLIFIDGMHLVEYALRDFINTEKIASAGSVVVIDDIMPAHPAQAERKRSTSAWAGDVWKLWKILEEYRPDLYFLPVNASPTGLLFIAGLDPDSRVLENKYNEILSKYKRDLIPPRDILERNDVVSSGDDFITDFLAAMKKVRNRNAGKKEVAKVLKQKFGNKCTCRNNDRVLDLDRDKVVVYTAITAGYDTLQDPEYVAPGVDYVCFTDDPGLKSDVWQVIPLDDDEADAVRVAKMPKILPHKFLPGHSISIWVDGNIKHIGDVRTLIESNLNNTNMALFKHPENRTSLKEEVEICIQMRKDDPGLLANQMHVYKQLGLPADVRVPTCMIMLRRHHCADVRLTMDKWWNEIKKRSRRDQVSFPYVSWVNSLKYNLIDNNSRDNEVFQWQPHRNIVAGQHTTPNNRRVTMSEKSQENGHYSSAYFQQRKELAKTSAKKILEIIYSKIAPESVIDFGCATGTWLAEFRGLGVRDLCGIDGPWVNKDLLEIKREDFLVHDFNKKNYKPKQKYDLALCIEVAEHISKDMGEKLVASLTEASDRVLFSAAVKAQGGTGHINEQPQHYWADRFLSHGYVAVDMIRPLIWNDDSVNVIYKQNMLLYVKKGLAGDPNLKEMIVSQKYDLDKIHPELFWMRSNRK